MELLSGAAQALGSSPALVLIPPEVLESGWRQFGVPDRVAYVSMPEIVLNRSRIVAVANELVSGTVPEHVGMNLEG